MTTSFVINGTPYDVDLSSLPVDITLNTFLREHAQLTGTKFMCLEGGCGVCICVVRGKHPASGETRTWAVNSCLTLLNTCTDWQITTIEGIGNKRDGYHPIQKRLAKLNGSQCGFCSPAMVMNMYGLLESKGGKVILEEVENSFGGNICRCTGYRPILDAMKSFAIDSNTRVEGGCCDDIEDFEFVICPMAGRQCVSKCGKPLTMLAYENGTYWYWPHTLADVFHALGQVGNDQYMLVGGNTAHGVYRRSPDIKHFIDLHAVPELKRHSIVGEKLTLGGNLSLNEAIEIFQKISQRPGFEYCQQLWQHFDMIAHVPVRNTGTLAGNISIKKAHPEFPSDVFLTFEALNAQIVIQELSAQPKTISILDYLKLPFNKAVILAFELRAYLKGRFIYHTYKITPRAQNAHAFVNAAFLLDMDVTSWGIVNAARICFGNISPDFVHATATEAYLVGQNLFDKEVMAKIFVSLNNEVQPDDVLPEPSPTYRRALVCGLFYKTILKLAPAEKVRPEYRSGADILRRPLSSGTQTFETIEKNYPITQPVQKLDALIQCSGEAFYMDDTLTNSHAVYCAFANATRVGAHIEQIDASEALDMSGVIAFYTAKDIPGNNSFCDAAFQYEPEEIFCSDVVKYYDQPLGVVVAQTSDIAKLAATKVKVIYSNRPKTTILPTMTHVFEADAKERIKARTASHLNDIQLSDQPDISARGIFEMGGQYHFTMEPQTTVAVPFEDGLQIWSATQWMDQTQCVIAKMLAISANAVQLKVRRLGGAYGAKISRGNQVACAASLAAYKLNRPARFVQSIESMMNSNGKRWGCRSDYEFHIKNNGKIVGFTNTYYEDAGCTTNENPIEDLTPLTARNCYDLNDSNSRVSGQAVITDAPSSAWCRAPGSTEGIAMIENMLEHMAFEANLDPADVRRVNLKPGNKMVELLPRFLQSTEYQQRRKEIAAFNDSNRWVKRGLGLAIMEYPVDLVGQYAATVAIYHVDGTVVIAHGGIEMGQGMNTKIAQVAAHTLGIPLSFVKLEYSDTINGANSIVTGGSLGSESVCYAVRKACDTLNERLKPVRDALGKNASWQKVVTEAYARTINMIASEHYKQGDMKNYFVYGLGLTEIKLDILTGNHLIKRVDLLEDAGESLSPYIDVGQVEGAFVMLLGYWLTEHLVYERETGRLVTNRTWTYKPPGAKDIPIDFRIELLQKNPNPAGFMRSKTTGEPPACLAVSSIFAIQHALQSARQDAGIQHEWVRLGAPTTPETIVMNSGTDTRTFSLE
ncbi:xanthine dehydrogenase-like [Bactrocera tryoni]|uniref:xanthine dehydrogenase-like n=1 Tax=Bactrocera tryoni TaxID=59916 RepID=UPI001A961D0E|nr:xanthine dehydrogenase-like [Bactrocera tryoni]